MSRTAGEYKEFLRSGRWFRALPEELQDKLLAASVLRSLRGGERLFSRGDPPSGLYAVLDGAVRITATADSGKEALLTLIEAPGWFGEIAVFDGLPRTHDAIAEDEALVVHTPQADLHAILDADPKYWRDVGLLVAGKLRLAFVAMEDIALMPIAVRLARRIVMMAEGYGEWHGRKSRVVQIRQEQLAMMLATSRQTANQLLKELEGKGLVRVAYGGIEILDLEGLRRVAKV